MDPARSFAFYAHLTESAAPADFSTEPSTQKAYQTAAPVLQQNQNFLFGGLIDVISICKTNKAKLQRGSIDNLEDAYLSH